MLKCANVFCNLNRKKTCDAGNVIENLLCTADEYWDLCKERKNSIEFFMELQKLIGVTFVKTKRGEIYGKEICSKN